MLGDFGVWSDSVDIGVTGEECAMSNFFWDEQLTPALHPRSFRWEQMLEYIFRSRCHLQFLQTIFGTMSLGALF